VLVKTYSEQNCIHRSWQGQVLIILILIAASIWISDRITSVKRQCHWPIDRQRLKFKTAFLIFKCLRRLGPVHLVSYCKPISVNTSRFHLRSANAVTFTFDLLTLNFYSTSDVMRLNSVQNLSENAKSNNPQLSYGQFSAFLRAILGGGWELTELSLGCVDPTSPNLART